MVPRFSDVETPRDLLAQLSRRVRGWAILLDAGGAAEIVEPAEALRHLPVVQLEQERVSGQLHGASSWIEDHRRAVIHVIASAGTLHGYLAVGADDRVAPSEMDSAVELARSVLAFQLDKSRAVRRAERSLRSAVVQLMLAGLHREAALAVRRADISLPGNPVRVAIVTHVDGKSATPVDRVVDWVESDLPLAVADALCGEDDNGDLAIVLSSVEGDVTALTQLTLDITGVRIALSEPVPLSELPRAAREAARLSYTIGKDSPAVTTRSSAYGAGLLAQIDGPAVRAFVASLLAPIVEAGDQGSIDLLGTLRVFLECDGRWSEASERLGIHRHTLRYRIRKIEEVLDRRLDETGTRAELWIALKLTDA